MFTLIGAVIGFAAMLVARGRAGIAAGLAFLGLVLGVLSSVVFGFETALDHSDNLESLMNVDWSLSNWLAGFMAALPGVLGAAFARRD
jgi:small-conductance mechanosensitive channel